MISGEGTDNVTPKGKMQKTLRQKDRYLTNSGNLFYSTDEAILLGESFRLNDGAHFL